MNSQSVSGGSKTRSASSAKDRTHKLQGQNTPKAAAKQPAKRARTPPPTTKAPPAKAPPAKAPPAKAKAAAKVAAKATAPAKAKAKAAVSKKDWSDCALLSVGQLRCPESDDNTARTLTTSGSFVHQARTRSRRSSSQRRAPQFSTRLVAFFAARYCSFLKSFSVPVPPTVSMSSSLLLLIYLPRALARYSLAVGAGLRPRALPTEVKSLSRQRNLRSLRHPARRARASRSSSLGSVDR